MTEKTLSEKIQDANLAGKTSDEANEKAVLGFLLKAEPIIQDLRQICGAEGLSDDLSWTARAKQVLQQIEIGLLNDPLSVKVIQKISTPEVTSDQTEDDTPTE